MLLCLPVQLAIRTAPILWWKSYPTAACCLTAAPHALNAVGNTPLATASHSASPQQPAPNRLMLSGGGHDKSQAPHHDIDEPHAQLDGELAAAKADALRPLPKHCVTAHLEQALPAGRVHIDAGLVSCAGTVCIQTIKSTGSLKT